jgi:hypothetical protein
MNLKKSGKPFFGSLAYFAILGLIFSSIPFLYYFRFIHPKLTGKDKMTLLETETKKQIKSLGLLLEKSDSKEFYRQISDLLTKYVSVATDISPIEISKVTLINKLSEAGIPNDKTREYSELIKKCEEALYSTDNKTDKTDLLNSSIKMLTYLQNELKKKSQMSFKRH